MVIVIYCYIWLFFKDEQNPSSLYIPEFMALGLSILLCPLSSQLKHWHSGNLEWDWEEQTAHKLPDYSSTGWLHVSPYLETNNPVLAIKEHQKKYNSVERKARRLFLTLNPDLEFTKGVSGQCCVLVRKGHKVQAAHHGQMSLVSHSAFCDTYHLLTSMKPLFLKCGLRWS